jgi:hypothetical protein
MEAKSMGYEKPNRWFMGTASRIDAESMVYEKPNRWVMGSPSMPDLDATIHGNGSTSEQC